MTTLTEAELFCLRHLEREGLSSIQEISRAICPADRIQVDGWADRPLPALIDKGLAQRTEAPWRQDLYFLTPAGRAELEQREEEDL